MLLTTEYGYPDNEIYAYLSFGATITSFVLSVLAIFVTVQSSSNLYKQFTRIDNATNTINNAYKKIEESLATLKNVESDLHETSTDISNNLNDIADDIDDRINNRVQDIRNDLQNFAESLTSTTNNNTSQDSQSANNYKDFIEHLPYLGLIAMYACVIEKEKRSGKGININHLFKEKNNIYKLIIISIIATTISAGYIKGKIYIKNTNDDKQPIFECTYTSFNKDEIIKAIKKHGETEDIYMINNYFEENNY